MNEGIKIDDCVRFDEVTISLPDLRVWFQGEEIHLSLAQLRLLMVFLSDPYGRFTFDELIRRLQLTSKQSLAVLVNSVRGLLGQKYIFTMHGFGYAFAVEKP